MASVATGRVIQSLRFRPSTPMSISASRPPPSAWMSRSFARRRELRPNGLVGLLLSGFLPLTPLTRLPCSNRTRLVFLHLDSPLSILAPDVSSHCSAWTSEIGADFSVCLTNFRDQNGRKTREIALVVAHVRPLSRIAPSATHARDCLRMTGLRKASAREGGGLSLQYSQTCDRKRRYRARALDPT